MRNLVLFLSLTVLPLIGFGQGTVLTAGEDSGSDEAKLKVVVIPFHPVRYYFSDCDKDIASRSDLEIEDVRNSFRAGMDYAIEHKSEKDYDPVNLYQMKDSVSKSMMDRFYDNVSYAYATPTRSATAKQKKLLSKLRDAFAEKSARRKGSDMNGEECYTEIETEGKEYMALSFSNSEFFEELDAAYEADVYVTINQFEVKTDYEKCIDREHGIYTRRIKVHYDVFDGTGKRLYGDVVTAKYDSRSDDINEIIMDNFGFLGEYVAHTLPKK